VQTSFLIQPIYFIYAVLTFFIETSQESFVEFQIQPREQLTHVLFKAMLNPNLQKHVLLIGAELAGQIISQDWTNTFHV